MSTFLVGFTEADGQDDRDHEGSCRDEDGEGGDGFERPDESRGWHILELMDDIRGVNVVCSHLLEVLDGLVQVWQVFFWEHGVGVPVPRDNPVFDLNVFFDVDCQDVVFEFQPATLMEFDFLSGFECGWFGMSVAPEHSVHFPFPRKNAETIVGKFNDDFFSWNNLEAASSLCRNFVADE